MSLGSFVIPDGKKWKELMNKQRFLLIDKQRRQNARAYLDALPVDGSWQVTFEPYTKPRTLKQNSALFGVAYPAIMLAQGDRGAQSAEELHEFFCGERFGWVSYEVFGRKKIKPFRTTTRNEFGKRDLLSTEAMADFYDFVQQTMADFGLYVPDPVPNEIR